MENSISFMRLGHDAGEVRASLGIEVKPPLLTPFGELDRIEVCTDSGTPLSREQILQLTSLGEPLTEGERERVTIVHERAEGAEIFFSPIPRNPDLHERDRSELV